MQESDLEEFNKIILAVAELFEKTPSDNALEIWWQALKHLSIEQITEGMSKAIQDPDRPRFMPQPADVIKYAMPPKLTGTTAWAEVLDAMEQYGAYASIQFEDGSINAAIRDMGGWPQLCHRQASDEEPIWLQKDFEKRYEHYAAAGRILNQPLEGLHNLSNKEHGYLQEIKSPVLLGNAKSQIESKTNNYDVLLKSLTESIGKDFP